MRCTHFAVVSRGKPGRKNKKDARPVRGKKGVGFTKRRKTDRFSKSRKRKAVAKSSTRDDNKNGEDAATRPPLKRTRSDEQENVTSHLKRGGASSGAKRPKVEKQNPLVSMTRKERKETRRKGKGNYDMIKNALKLWENLRR